MAHLPMCCSCHQSPNLAAVTPPPRCPTESPGEESAWGGGQQRGHEQAGTPGAALVSREASQPPQTGARTISPTRGSASAGEQFGLLHGGTCLPLVPPPGRSVGCGCCSPGEPLVGARAGGTHSLQGDPLHSHTPRKGTPTHPHAPPGRALAASGPPPAGPPRPGRLSAVAGDVVPPRGPLPCPPPAAAGCSERNSRMGTPALLSLLRVHEVRVTGGMWKKIIKTIKEKITTRRQGEMHDSPRSRCKLGLWSPARSFTQQNQAHGLSRTSWAGQPGPAERCDAAWRLRRRSGSALGIH